MGRAEAEGADGEVSVAAHGPRPDVLASKTRRGLLFQAMKNRYLIGTYEAVVHRILGRYVGLRRDPKFLQALDVVRPPWAPAQIPEFPSDEGAAARASDCDGSGAPRPAGWGGAGHAGGLAGRSGPPVVDAAAEVQDLVNRLGALSGAAGVYLVPRLPGPVPAPMGSGSSSALPGGLVMVDGGGPAARSVGGP